MDRPDAAVKGRAGNGQTRIWAGAVGSLPPLGIEGKTWLCFAKSVASLTQINVDRRWDIFASALPLQTLELVHGSIQLAVEMSLGAEDFLGCFRGRQAEPSGVGFERELLTFQRVFLE